MIKLKVLKRALIFALLLLLLCACTVSGKPDPISFPAEFPQISFESYPLGAPAEQACDELGCSEDVLRELEQFGSAIAEISPEAFERGGGTLCLKGVPMDHMQVLFRDDALESVSWFFYIRQFDSPEDFFTAVADWHAALSETLRARGFTEESSKLSELRSAADFEENTLQASFWNNGVYQLELTLSGSGDSICCKALIRAV